jgi:kynurenine formamidase
VSSRIVDLTVTLTNNMLCHKFFPRPVIVPLFTHDEMETWGLGVPGDTLGGCTTYLGMMDHVGTHIDAFVHTKRGGATIDEMPLDLFMGKAVCLDLRHIPDLGDIDVKDLEEAEKKSGVKIDGHIVLICTGLHERHFPRESVVHSNAGITAAATHWLGNRSRVHGVEGPSTDKPSETFYPNHRVCRDRGLTHYEWLCNLEQLLGKGEFQFHGLPLKIGKGSGSPVRAIALLN